MAARKKSSAAEPADRESVRVRLTAWISGSEPALGPGDVIEVDASEAERLVEIGAAERE